MTDLVVQPPRMTETRAMIPMPVTTPTPVTISVPVSASTAATTPSGTDAILRRTTAAALAPRLWSDGGTGVRVLVTGATGFLGRELVGALRARGDEVRILARSSSRLGDLAGQVEVAHGDVLDPASVAAAVKDRELVFHTAGLVSTLAREHKRMFQVNVDGTRNVLQAALAAGVKRVVYTSSSYAVGHTLDGRALDETATWEDPGVAYARSKRRAEEAAFSVAREGLPLVVVNPSFVLGPGGGEGSSGRIVRRFLDGKMKFYVEGGFSPVDVADVAQGHLAAAEKGRLGERYLLSGENVSFAQFFSVLSEVAGGPMPKRVPGWFALGATQLQERVLSPLTGKPPVADLDEVLMGRLIRYFDNSKARAELAFNPRPLRETLERTVQWMRQAELSRRD
ncbi:MAG: SDR family oxidoreductase [Chloroflexota bacterium]